jgi:Filamin/ABP280 repeat/Invasin, domain 3/Bacterial Ig-like domain (group 1)
MHLPRRALACVLLLALGACGGGDLTLPNEGQPADVAVFSGNGQTGTILEAPPQPLVVRVTDRFGNPVAGVPIEWSATGGGDVRPASAVTDTDGRAATQRILGSEPGDYATTAMASVLPSDAVSFTTTAVAAKLVLVTQPGARASSGEVIDPQPVLQLQDPAGNPLAREAVSVSVQIASGEGTLHGTTTQTSDAGGQIAFTDLSIEGPPGARTLIFAASGYASAISTPVSLGVGAPASVVVAAGDGQSATAGTQVLVAPAVLVRDAGGTPVAGVGVAFAVASGGGNVSGGEATTGADGVATVSAWRLGSAAGPNTLTATVDAPGVVGNPVTFTATSVGGPPSASKSSVSASPKTIVASQGSAISTITIVLQDDRGNPLAGESVTLAATGAGVTLGQPALTDASGTTTGSFSATGSGDHDISAVAGGVTVGTETVTVTPDVPDASHTSATVPNGSAGTTTEVLVALQDQFGNPVGGAAGQIAVTVTGANNVGGVNVEDRGGGSYRARYTPVIAGTDQVDVRVAGQPVPGSPFSSTVAPGAADPDMTTASVPDGSFAEPLEIIVSVRDKQGNPLGRGGDQVRVMIEHGLELAVEDRGDGTYRAEWIPRAVGTFKVDILLNGKAIKGSPFLTNISFF